MKRLLVGLIVILALWGAMNRQTALDEAPVQLAGELGDVKPTQGEEPKGRTGGELRLQA